MSQPVIPWQAEKFTVIDLETGLPDVFIKVKMSGPDFDRVQDAAIFLSTVIDQRAKALLEDARLPRADTPL